VEAFTRRTTTSEANEGTEDLPPERGMGCMNDNNNYESGLWKLLEKEKLTDLSQFHQRGFFDEVSLYSRESDVDFLPDDEKAASAILLRFSLKFLKAVIAYEEHRTAFFAAITVWSFSPDPLVPNLFVWCGAIRELEDRLTLNEVRTPFGRRVKRLVSRLRLSDQFQVLEDTSTIPDSTRVFLAPTRLPYLGFVPLDTFRRPANAAK
jgi:hypothetical protein